MNEQRKHFLNELAYRLADIYAAAEPKPSTMTAAKLVRSTLSKFDIVDEVSIITRKLKDGGQHTLVKVGDHIIDITSEHAFSEIEEEHPLFANFKGRGRDPIDRDAEVLPSVSGRELSVPMIIRAIMVSPKSAASRLGDEEMLFHIKLKDVRTACKRLGSLSSYETIKRFIKDQMPEDVKADEIVNGVQTVTLRTKRTVAQWTQERMTVAERIEELFQQYVKNTQATG